MVKVIMGVKGTGKTKQMIDLINNAVNNEHGNVVCIEKGRKLTYDISYHIRLVEAEQYNLSTFEVMRGFISGMYAGNYDITHIFIDSLCKIVPSDCGPELDQFLAWLDNFSEKNNIKFTISISADESLASDDVKKFF